MGRSDLVRPGNQTGREPTKKSCRTPGFLDPIKTSAREWSFKCTTNYCWNVAPLNGGNANLLTRSPSTLPRWSPDGKWIAFSPARGFAGGIFIIGVDGDGERRLTKTGGWPVWWPDGKQIGYLAIGPDGKQQIRTVPFEGGPSRALPDLRFSGRNHPFDVSREGSLLATTNASFFSAEIWLLDTR